MQHRFAARGGGPNSHPTALGTDISTVSLYVRPDEAAPFLEWHDRFVVQGNNAAVGMRSGSITYFANARQPALTLTLSRVGITAIQDYVIDDEPMLKVDLFVDSVGLARPSTRDGVGAPGGNKGRRRPVRRGR